MSRFEYKEVSKMSTAEMVAEYNAIMKKQIKKFSSRANGEKQLIKARASKQGDMHWCDMELKRRRNEEEATQARHRVSVAIRSWQDPEVRAKRAKRHGVVVECPDGVVRYYKSVKVAFEDLGFSLGAHIRFRQKLKDKGEYKFHTGMVNCIDRENRYKVFNFKLITESAFKSLPSENYSHPQEGATS
jgi:hypothetical protein